MVPNRRGRQKTFNQWMVLLKAFKRKHNHLKTSVTLNKSLHRWLGRTRSSLKVYNNQKVKTKNQYILTPAQVRQLERIGISSTQGTVTAERKKKIREAKEKSYKKHDFQPPKGQLVLSEVPQGPRLKTKW